MRTTALFVVLLSLAAAWVTLAADPISPEVFCVRFVTDVKPPHGDGAMLLNVTRALAPLGADRLHALVLDHFFDAAPAAFFRVVPKFVVQFGISGEPAMNSKWNVPIVDDPVRASNTAGTVSFATAGPNTRTTQLFINYGDNARLDGMGFAPFATVVRGMKDVAEAVNNPTPGSSDGVDQDQYAAGGYAWIEAHYPAINSIVNATVHAGSC